MQNSTVPTKHVAALAFPFGSHPLALLNLVKKLAIASPNTQFSFLNLADSNNSLFLGSKANNNNLIVNIKPYNVGDGVPINHVFSGNPIERLELFIKATPSNFKKGLELAMAELGQISCLITDAFLVFSGSIANELSVSWIPVWIPIPHSLSTHIYTDMIRRQYPTNGGDDKSGILSKTLETIPGLDKMRVEDLPDEVLYSDKEHETLFSSMLSQMGLVLPQASAVVLNFYHELYSKPLLDDIKSKFPRLLNVGFVTLSMPPPPLPLSSTDSTGCLSWLDNQNPKSVAYISFGTVARVPPNEVKELAEALEESKIPFLWSLGDNLKVNLPNGFEKTNLHGKVVSWAPQTQVLAHNSVGVFVTHCGANSVSESMANGVPMICRPVFADHMINARLAEEIWQTGVKVDNGVFTKNGVIKNLKLILSLEDGKGIRRNVQALQELILKAASPNGYAAQDFKTLVEMLSSN